MDVEKPTRLSDYWVVIMKYRRILLINTIIITTIAIIISLILPCKYTATATILPPSQEQTSLFGFLNFGSGLSSNIANLSRLTSGLPGLYSPSDLFAAILKSGRIKGPIIKKYNLMKEFKTKTMIDASRALDEITKIEVSPEGMISVSVTYKNKYLATDIANSFIEELDKFNKETAMTSGKKFRIFVEQQLKNVQDSLAKAEEALRKFQEEHRTVALDIEIENAIATIAKLKSEIVLREVQKGAVASISNLNNPYVTNIDQELRELKRQLAKIEFGTSDTARKEFGAGFSVPFARLPGVSLEYARLLRNVKIQEAIYELLTQQYEQAKIMESKDTPTVQFLEQATPPEKRSFPKRTLIVLFAFFLSIVFDILLAFILDYFNEVKKSPHSHQTFINTLNSISEDIIFIKEFVLKKAKRK
uniref:Polysaccharide chain length determinant N-terminal domain-containing protein n=1 Tax=candidate division WOR-3 bacterium TaxID=2052148 RepID=A0A7V0Z704_UNCW3